MARIVNTITNVSTTATTLTTSTLITLATTVDTREALSGALHINFSMTTAQASRKIDIYALYSRDGTNFDTARVDLANKIGTINMPPDTTAHDVTIPLDGVTLSAQYMRIALWCDATSNVGRSNAVRVSIRKAV